MLAPATTTPATAEALRPRAEHLERLADKYRTLAMLRRERADGAAPPPAATFKALAREFPGALQELDTLPLELVDERAAELAAAARGQRPVAPWMEWLFAWHALMRGALLVKAALRGARSVDPERAAELAARAAAVAGVPFPPALVHGVARPPDGRIARLVFAHAAAGFGVTAEALSDGVFPAGAGRRRRAKSAADP